MNRLFLILVTMLSLSSTTAPVIALDDNRWASFQNGGSLSLSDEDGPTKWSAETGVAWTARLDGYGQSMPVVYKDCVYVTSVSGENKESLHVHAINCDKGTVRWTHVLKNSSPEKNTTMVSRAAPTPVVDQQGVIALFGGGNLIALDHDGEPRWQRDLKSEYGKIEVLHGLAASLEQNSKHVFVWIERQDSPYIVAVNKSNGETIWKKPGLGATSWGSPRLLNVAGKPHLVLSGSGVLQGLDPETGQRLWDFTGIAGNTASTAVPVDDGKILISSMGSANGKNANSCGVIQITHDGTFKADWLWSVPGLRCSFGSPIAFDGKAYFVNRTGVVQCHDLKTGAKLFAGRLETGQVWATPIATNDGIYFFGTGGLTSIIDRAGEFKIIEKNQLWKPSTGKPSNQTTAANQSTSGAVLYAAILADSKLILRRGDVLYAVVNQ